MTDARLKLIRGPVEVRPGGIARGGHGLESVLAVLFDSGGVPGQTTTKSWPACWRAPVLRSPCRTRTTGLAEPSWSSGG